MDCSVSLAKVTNLEVGSWLGVQCVLMLHVEGVLEHALSPHVLAVLGAGESELTGFLGRVALYAECALVIYHVCYIHPPGKHFLFIL